MVFSSLLFLFVFLPLNLALYFLSPNQKYRNGVLIVFSLAFYAWGEPVWIILLLISASVDYMHGRIIENNRGNYRAKAALISSLVINLSLLGIFKYSGFIVENINQMLSLNIPVKEFGLPIGISFYTFQTLSYTVDVYRGQVRAQKDYHRFLLFVSLFHQLVAGPIVRYKDIAKEIDDRHVTLEGFSYGITRFVGGLGKKVIIANTAGELASGYLDQSFSQLSVITAWFGITMFAIQIYFDFSGYSDMAIGLGRMFGFTYKENFNYPYISKSATEFWRRWHISLGSFFRDYVYIPLGGNRANHIRNILLVWFLTGLWHGASWNFVLWGMYFGMLLLVEKIILHRILEKLPKLIQHGYLLVACLIGWVLFYFTDLSQVTAYLKVMFGLSGQPIVTSAFYIQFMNHIIFLAVAVIAATPIGMTVIRRFVKKIGVSQTKVSYGQTVFNTIIMVISIAMLVGQSYNPFLYFRF